MKVPLKHPGAQGQEHGVGGTWCVGAACELEGLAASSGPLQAAGERTEEEKVPEDDIIGWHHQLTQLT